MYLPKAFKKQTNKTTTKQTNTNKPGNYIIAFIFLKKGER